MLGEFLKRLAVAALIALAVGAARHSHGQGVPITALPSATLPITGAEYTILSQSGTTVKATVAQVISPSLTIPNNTVLGNVSGSTGTAVAVTANQLTALLGLGTAAFVNTGAGGHAVPFLDVANTWTGAQTFSNGVTANTLHVTSTSTFDAAATFRQINLAGSGSGTISILPQAAAGTFSFNLPITAGAANGPLLSQGGGTTAMTWGTPSGSTSKFGTVMGSLTNGNCIAADSSGNLIDNGGPCGSGGSGTVTSGTAGQLAYYASSTNAVAGNANVTVSSGALTLGVAASVQGQLKLTGSTGGTITITGQAAAGTYEIDLPTTAGSSGSPLLSGGGGGTPMTYGTRSGNTTVFGTTTGTLTSTHIAAFDASGNIVDGGAAPVPFMSWGGAKTTDFNASSNTQYCVDTATTGAVTMTLPGSPSDGDKVLFIDCKSNFASASLTVARNGKTIMGVAANMTVSTTNAAATLVYVATYTDWRMY